MPRRKKNKLNHVVDWIISLSGSTSTANPSSVLPEIYRQKNKDSKLRGSEKVNFRELLFRIPIKPVISSTLSSISPLSECNQQITQNTNENLKDK